MAILEILNEAFESLFFGSGILLGLILIILLCVSLAIKWKYGGIISIVVLLFMGMDYSIRLNQNPQLKFFWGMMSCFVTAILILIYMINDRE